MNMKDRTCQGPKCRRSVFAKYLCRGHYEQQYKGRPLTRIKKGTRNRTSRGSHSSKYNTMLETGKWYRERCSAGGCRRGVHALYLCDTHYRQLRRTGKTRPIWKRERDGV